MKVQDPSLAASSTPTTLPPGGVSRQPGAGGSTRTRPAGTDRVDFSGLSGRLGSVLGAQSAERAARVASLGRDVQSGRYQPDASQTSRALVRETLSATAAEKGR
jgi:hypothetical protein